MFVIARAVRRRPGDGLELLPTPSLAFDCAGADAEMFLCNAPLTALQPPLPTTPPPTPGTPGIDYIPGDGPRFTPTPPPTPTPGQTTRDSMRPDSGTAGREQRGKPPPDPTTRGRPQ